MKRNIKKTYIHLKAKYPDAILLLRCADFYKAWDTDAELICKIIDTITLHKKKTIITCRILINRIDEVLYKLVKAGYRVAVCDPL